MNASRFDAWLQALEQRHLTDLTFSEVARALRALSSAYVERRGRLARGAALDGAGKRAAFALFYGPLHFLLTREIVRRVSAAPAESGPLPGLIDLGCGTGAAGAAWALELAARPAVFAVERNPWAAREAAWTYRTCGINARVKQGDVLGAWMGPGARPPRGGRFGIAAAFTVNELPADSRVALLPRLLDEARRGQTVLIIEPLARAAAPWWNQWQAAFEKGGGRADEWRFRVELPDRVRQLDRAAGLDHRELTARSLWIDHSPRVAARKAGRDS